MNAESPGMQKLARRTVIASLAVPLLPACGGGGELEAPPPPPPPPPLEHTVHGRFARRVLPTATGYVALEEAPVPYRSSTFGGPVDRRIRVARGAPGTEALYAPPAGWSLIDLALHPSGELSAVLANGREVRLVRLDLQARVLSSVPLADAAAPSDPFYDFGGIKDDASLLPLHTRDAVRVAPLGEDLAVALRTGRHAVVAYRYTHTAQGYVRRWRRMVEPGTTVMARYLSSGSHDTYSQLVNHYQVLLATDAQGSIAVGVPASPHNNAYVAHYRHFFIRFPGDPTPPPAPPDHGALVTLLDGEGRQQREATHLTTDGPTQIHALRALEGGGWALAGRTRAAVPGGEWSGLAAWLDGAGKLQRQALLRVEQDSVLFDIAALPGGRTLVAGGTGYRQNPVGASISDHGAPLVAVLGPDGRLAERIALPTGAGQNPVLSLARAHAPGHRWWVAGMRHGPGTHTADSDPALLRADGFVREVAVP